MPKTLTAYQKLLQYISYVRHYAETYDNEVEFLDYCWTHDSQFVPFEKRAIAYNGLRYIYYINWFEKYVDIAVYTDAQGNIYVQVARFDKTTDLPREIKEYIL